MGCPLNTDQSPFFDKYKRWDYAPPYKK